MPLSVVTAMEGGFFVLRQGSEMRRRQYMGFEIERKWLIRELPEGIEGFPHKEYVQGYLCTEPTVRVRREGDEYVLTYKGAGLLKREEYNLPLTEASFRHLITKCDGRLIHKTRYFIPVKDKEGLMIELDIYKEELSGLMTAEIEFPSEAEAMAFEAPDWFSEDVSLRPEYKNSALAMDDTLDILP